MDFELLLIATMFAVVATGAGYCGACILSELYNMIMEIVRLKK